jgi:hypothetical protein
MMGDDDARFLVNLMRKKPHLTTLCGITDKMKSLDLSNQDLVDADAILLVNEIQLNSTLSTVNVLGNTFSCGPALKLVDAMKTNPKLMTLCGIKGNLPELQILGKRLSPGCAILLANEIEDRDRIVLIKDLKNAKHLNGLSGKVQRVLGNSNCKVLLANGESKSIKPANLEMQRAMLLSADLSCHLVPEEYIGAAEVELGKFTLGDSMCWQGKQGVLVGSHSGGGSWFFEITGASALIDALPTHLTSLDVSKNKLVSNLHIKLANAVKNMPTLNTLDISKVSLGDPDGWVHIREEGEGEEEDSALSPGLIVMIDAVSGHPSMSDLHIGNNRIPRRVMEKLRALCVSCPKMRLLCKVPVRDMVSRPNV